MRLLYPMLAGVIACAMLFLGNAVILAQEKDKSEPEEGAQQASPSPDEQEAIKGYPVRERQMGGPTDVGRDLDNSFPKRDSVLELILRCRESQRQ
jgi:hypothetical protein